MSIVITGITGLHNRGVEALIVPTIDQIHQRIPNQKITVLTQTPDYDALQIKSPKVGFMKGDFQVKVGRKFRLLSKAASILGQELVAESQTEAANVIRSASMILASGGDVFSSEYGNLKRHLVSLELAQRYDVPVMFLAHSIGPFKRQEEVDIWKKVAQKSSLVTVRESLTYNYLINELGLSTEQVRLTADPAFLLSPPSLDKVERMVRYYGIEPDRPIVALAVSQGISRFAGVSADDHFRAWRRVIQMLLEDSKSEILIIPHVQATSTNNDDRIIATNLLKSFDYEPRLHLAGGVHSASEFKGMIGACDMVIAERMHAAIAGLSSGVCTVVVGYSVKADGIMNDMLAADLTHTDFLIPIDEFVKNETVSCVIKDAWQRRQEVANCLKQILPQIKKRALNNFDLLVDVLAQG